MKKNIIWILAAIMTLCLGVGVLAACGEKDDGPRYTVTYADGATDEEIEVPVDTNTYKEGEIVIIKEGIERTDFTFNGWRISATTVLQPGAPLTMPGRNVTLTADWEAIAYATYSVTYDLDGGEGLTPTETAKRAGAIFKLAAEPTREGFKFLGWSDGYELYDAGAEYSMPAEDVKFTAVWAEYHSVTYDLNGGEGETPTEEDQAAGSLFLLAAAPSRDGHIFLGWSDGVKVYPAGSVYTMPDREVTLTAQWRVIGATTYTVTYELNGGDSEVPTEMDHAVGEMFTLAAAATREGYEFLYWSDGKANYEAETSYTMPAGAVTLTAKWAKLYTVSYDLQGGNYDGDTTPPTERDHKAGDTFNLAEKPSRSGCLFIGWYDGEKVYNAKALYTMPEGDVTLTARWQEPLELASGGSVEEAIIGKIDNPTILELNAPYGDYKLTLTDPLQRGRLAANIYVVVGDETIILNDGSSNSNTKRETIRITAETGTTIRVYTNSPSEITNITITLQADLNLRPGETVTVTIPQSGSAVYTIKISAYGHFKLVLENGDGVSIRIYGSTVLPGETFEADPDVTITFTAPAGTTFTATLVQV